jgi:hypothetical protein
MRRLLLLLLTFLAFPGVAHADWYEASTTHFVVYSDDKPETVRQFATNLERFDKALRFLRNLGDDPVSKANRVTIFIVGDVPMISRLAHDSSAAGFYLPRAGDAVAFVPRDGGLDQVPEEYKDLMLTPQQILLHEYTHHFLHSVSPNTAYPLWFSEGYAEFFASSVFEPDGSVIIGRPPLYRSLDIFGENKLPASKMLTFAPSDLTGEQRYLLYGRGWLLTHYLFLGGKRDGQLGAYFRALTEGKPAAEAAQAFGDLRKLDSELWGYKRTDFGAERVPAAKLPIGDVAVRKLSPAESATMMVRIRSSAGVRPGEAAGIYADAKAACAPYPNDPAAQRVLAEAAFDAEDYPGAEAAADRLIAADPKSVDGLLYKARVHMALATNAKDTSPETWLAIRRLIAAANRADTENPLPLWLYYQAYAASGQPVPKSAKDGLYYAYMLAPQDLSLRFDAADVHLHDGEIAPARAMLLTVALDPHAGDLAKLAAKMVADIDADHPEAAIAEIEKRGQDSGDDGKGKKKR